MGESLYIVRKFTKGYPHRFIQKYRFIKIFSFSRRSSQTLNLKKVNCYHEIVKTVITHINIQHFY